MKKLNLLFVVCFFVSAIDAQTLVALHHQGTTTLYPTASGLVDANAAAQNGDTIYIPGGFFTSITISKRLVVIGTGHTPDSTLATGRTYLYSNLTLNDGADSSHIEGLYINGDLNFAADADIDDVVIRRCNFGTLNITGGSKTNDRTLINQNIIRGNMDLNNTNALIFKNNIFLGRMWNATQNTIFDHNALLTCIGGWDGNCFTTVSNVLFTNNVIEVNWGTSSGFLAGDNNIFQNNIFSFDPTGSWWNNTYTNNKINISTDSIFVNRALCSGFGYTQDFNIKTSSQGKNAATDGTDIGIYGGSSAYTFKIASVPFNPHISTKTIAPMTNSSGKLGVDIKVNAQEK
ncbi:MAG: hypothetical protein PHD97_03270 [Bacteroidales bacterium]|nr:hypothetical protein [Bacteroidales bacterium]